MNLAAAAIGAAEALPWPDRMLRTGVAMLVERTSRHLDRADPAAERAFAAAMAEYPIAAHTGDANAQHYEVPAAFFELVLGPRRKYSCCLYSNDTATLAEAEELALAETAEHAALQDGQDILELGCGWGSLTLWMGEHFPRSQITAVSNSHSQGRFIREAAARRGLSNVMVETADMNRFAPARQFDRVVSVEMFEHMSNWTELLGRAHWWLRAEGRLFLHVFAHRSMPYRFDHNDKADWIGQHFFTGGIMPSHALIRRLPLPFAVEAEWRWNGRHYQRTADDWLRNFDRHRAAVVPILREVYGDAAPLWERRWRLFFIATAGLFGARDGAAWGVSHYRLASR